MSTNMSNNPEVGDGEISQRRRSSFFGRARTSFFRGNGHRGANVETLRGTQGATFEGSVEYITRGVPNIGTGMCSGCCCLTNTSSSKDRYLLIKGPFCFVFVSKDDTAPKYAIGLQSMHAHIKSFTALQQFVVLLQNEMGDIEYQFTFLDMEIAQQFKMAIDTEVVSAQVAEVRKRLGHEHLLSKRSSLRYAETIALQKISDQPSAPITDHEINSTIIPPM